VQGARDTLVSSGDNIFPWKYVNPRIPVLSENWSNEKYQGEE